MVFLLCSAELSVSLLDVRFQQLLRKEIAGLADDEKIFGWKQLRSIFKRVSLQCLAVLLEAQSRYGHAAWMLCGAARRAQ